MNERKPSEEADLAAFKLMGTAYGGLKPAATYLPDGGLALTLEIALSHDRFAKSAWIMEPGLKQACKNIGYDLTCGRCAGIFFTGTALEPHDGTCTTAGCSNAGVIVTQDARTSD